MTEHRPRILGVGGTTRAGSLTELVLRAALARAEALGAVTRVIAGPALDLPVYDPGMSERSDAAATLVSALREADGIILASPGYHGSVSGLIKNALDYAEDLREDARPYFSNRAVGLVVCADGVQALGGTLSTLRSMTHALRGWPTPYALLVRGRDRPIDADGRCTDARTAEGLDILAGEIVEFARRQALPLEALPPAPPA